MKSVLLFQLNSFFEWKSRSPIKYLRLSPISVSDKTSEFFVISF